MPNIWITILALERQSKNIIPDSFINLFSVTGIFKFLKPTFKLELYQ